MGAMKRLYGIRRAGGGGSLSYYPPEERKGWIALESGSANLIRVKEAIAEFKAIKPTNALESIALVMDYTGINPTVDGKYLVIDLVTDSLRTAIVGSQVGDRRPVRFFETGTITTVGEVVNPNLRWFLLPKLNQEELAFARELPT